MLCGRGGTLRPTASPAFGSKQMGLTHERKTSKSSGHVSQRRTQEQDLRHHLPRQRSQVARQHHLVRQFLRAAAPRRTGAAGLQARDLHRDADGTGPAAGPGPGRARGSLTRAKSAKAGAAKARGARHASRETRRAIVLHVAKKSGGDSSRSEESRLEEAVAPTAATGLRDSRTIARAPGRAPPRTLIRWGDV